MRPYLFLLASLFLLCCVQQSLAGDCRAAVTQSCTLAPYNVQLSQQVFCPRNDARASALERNGSSCSELQYCCQSLNRFNSPDATAAVRTVGLQFSYDQTSGALRVPAGKEVTLEFLKEACVASLSFSGVDSLEITSVRFVPNAAVRQESLTIRNGDGSNVLNLCRLAAISIRVPAPANEDSEDTVASINGINVCLLGADVDTCGVCNGNGVCPTEAPAGAPVRNNAIPPPINDRLEQQTGLTNADNSIGATWSSSNSQIRRVIEPVAVCNTRLPSSDYCFAVFGYYFADYNVALDGTPCVYVPPSRNFFLPDPGYRGQPCIFHAPGPNLNGSFGVMWDCTTHHHTKLSWVITSNSSDAGGLVTRSATASREVNTCSDYFLSWLNS